MSKPRAKSKKDKELWDSIYRILTKYGGFYNQTDATNELLSLTNKQKDNGK